MINRSILVTTKSFRSYFNLNDMKLTIDDVLSLRHIQRMNVEGLKPKATVHVSTDSRSMKSGDVFFAIRGEKYDGHQFVDKAFEAGAAIAVVDDRSDVPSLPEKPMIVVKDTTKALGHLANTYRRKFSIPFLAVAGSNGKTTSKDMIADVLSKTFSVLKTEGNLNNHIGVPKTLFRLGKKHDIAVIEVGTNHPGELKYLCGILEPTHGLVTNIGREHLEFFHDLKGVAKEEGTLFDSLGSAGTSFVNVDDPWVLQRSVKLKDKITYGFTKQGNVRGMFLGLDKKACGSFSVKVKGKKEFVVRLSVPGKQAVANALAASTVGIEFGIPTKHIRTSLFRFSATSKRMQVYTMRGVTIIDDTYNANPESMVAALETLGAMRTRGKKIAVLADMLELGEYSTEEHRTVGEKVGEFADCLLTYGRQAKVIFDNTRVKMKFHYDQKNVLSEYLQEFVTPGDMVLVKGSRGMAMEDVVTFLLERLKHRLRNAVSLAG